MGNSISMSSSASHIDPNDYQIVGKSHTIRWGEVYETKNSANGQKVYMQERFTNDYETHQKNIAECSHRLSLSHSNLACLLGFSQSDTPDSSNNAYRINLYFEHVATTLSDLISMRASGSTNNKASGKKGTVSYFDESELLRYLNQLIDVLSYLQMNDICLGDITPDVCFLSEHGNIKVLDRKLLFRNISAFDSVKQGATDVFLTPGELKALENGYSRSAENRYKADLFRLGMTVVECATLRPSADVYDWRAQSINIEALSSRLIEIKERYSNTFYNMVRELLRFDESKRTDFLTLNQRIQEESAVNLESSLSKVEEAQLRSPGINKLKVTSPLASKKGEHVEEKSTNVKSPFQNEKQAYNQKVMPDQRSNERGRVRDRESQGFEDDTQELGNNMRINNIRGNESLNTLNSPDNPFNRSQNQAEVYKSNNFNMERVQNPGSAKKATPVKTSANENTPSKPVKIFGPIKSPELIQSTQIFSPTTRGTEKSGQALIFQSPEVKAESSEKVEKMYSPFNHRPSNSDITSPPISAQNFNFDNLKNFPQLGKYTRSTVTDKNPLNQSASLENALQSRVSPEKMMSQSYQSPVKPQTMPTHAQFNELQPQLSSVSNYYSPKTKSNAFNPLDDRRSSVPTYQTQIQQEERLARHTSPIQEVNVNMMGRLSNKEPGPEKYFDAYIPTFGGSENQQEQDSEDLMDAYKMSFSNKAFVSALPAEGRRDKKIPMDTIGSQVKIVTESSPKSPSFDTRNSLPMFGGQVLKEEPRSFGLSAGAPVAKELRNSPAKTPILGGEKVDEKTMKIDDRFERAMQRSKRSEGFVKEMSRSASRSPLRK